MGHFTAITRFQRGGEKIKYNFDPRKVTSLVAKTTQYSGFQNESFMLLGSCALFIHIVGQNMHVSASSKISCKTRHGSHAPVQGHGLSQTNNRLWLDIDWFCASARYTDTIVNAGNPYLTFCNNFNIRIAKCNIVHLI